MAIVLDRYILRLWLAPFLTSLTLVTGILLLSRALKVLGTVAESGVAWSILFTMLAAVLPYFLVLTIPVAAFFATQSLLLRLSQESELDALRAAGVSYLRLGRPIVVVSLLLFGLLAVTTMQWMPQGQKAFQGLLYALQKTQATPGFDPQRFNRDLENFTVYVEGRDREGRLQGFMLEDRRSRVAVIYLAREAEIERVGEELRFTLFDGTRLEGSGETLRSVSFAEYVVSIGVGQMGMAQVPEWRSRIYEMTFSELRRHLQSSDDPAAVAEWHRRFILPTSIFVLLLFALPLSVEPKRSGKAGAYVLGILLMLVVYNAQIVLHQQAAAGALPWWSMWAGQFAFAAIGLELSRRAARDRLPPPLAMLGELFYTLHTWFASRVGRRTGGAS